jgi:ubiquinone biosynthesis protein
MLLFCIPSILFEILKYNIYLIDFKNFIMNCCKHIAKVNIFYIKIFQWFTYDINKDPNINKELFVFFSQYTNSVPYKETDIDYISLNKLKQEITTNGDEFYINTIPINMGTIAIVFQGKINNNNVVIKLLRNNIHHQLNIFYKEMEYIGIFLKNIQKIYKWIQYYLIFLPKYNNHNSNNIMNIIYDCKDEFSLQLDLLNEANNIEIFQNDYKNCKYIIIPHVYTQYTKNNPNVLVMEYITGHNINDNTIEENTIYLDIIHKLIFSSYFIKEKFHADLHLGNIFFIKENDENNKIQYKLGLIDFGLVGNINSILEQNFIYELFIGYTEHDHLKLIDNILEYLQIVNSITFDEQFKNKIYEETKEINIFQTSSTITHYDIYTFIKLLQSYNVKVTPRLSFLLLAVVSQSASVNKLKDLCGSIDLSILIKNIMDNLLK